MRNKWKKLKIFVDNKKVKVPANQVVIKKFGIVLEGKCQKSGGNVARVVEDPI
jgi:hypothetical protein